MKKLITILGIAVLALALAPAASADPIGGSNPCPEEGGTGDGSCMGVIYTLTIISQIDNGDGTTTYQFKLTADTSGYTGSSTDKLTAASIKVTSSGNIDEGSIALISSPNNNWNLGFDHPTGGTTVCPDDSLGSGFVCASNATGVAVGSNTYEWVWELTITNGTLFTGDFGASIGVKYTTATGKNAGITSAGITIQCDDETCESVPEPGTITLFGAGLLGLAALRRRLS